MEKQKVYSLKSIMERYSIKEDLAQDLISAGVLRTHEYVNGASRRLCVLSKDLEAFEKTRCRNPEKYEYMENARFVKSPVAMQKLGYSGNTHFSSVKSEWVELLNPINVGSKTTKHNRFREDLVEEVVKMKKLDDMTFPDEGRTAQDELSASADLRNEMHKALDEFLKGYFATKESEEK